MPSLPARLTLGQALAALAQKIDPELCTALAAAGEDLQRNIAGPSMLDWLPSWRLVERRRRFVAELLSRGQAGRWKLIRLPNEPGQGEDQLTDLEPDDLDIEKSQVTLGGQHYRVRVVTEPEPIAPPHNPDAEAAPAPAPPAAAAEATTKAQLQARYNARVTPEHVPTREEDRALAAELGIPQTRVAELRSNSPDPRLHTRGRRRPPK